MACDHVNAFSCCTCYVIACLRCKVKLPGRDDYKTAVDYCEDHREDWYTTQGLTFDAEADRKRRERQ